ncbi:excalibur calcium-binding domain-containing protein [Phycicoccus avicenniae]|uniref:excalibur calcium-binding domain-containing protein n=1 Tax=Phycicoccus avicenniae TaxID=2828860 RepID=UPI003D2936B5
MKKSMIPAVLAAATLALGTATAAPASAVPAKWKNCTTVNKTYKHGVGKKKAKDRTSGKPVTTFTKSDKLYAEAMRANKGLDRDKDGIACEKR